MVLTHFLAQLLGLFLLSLGATELFQKKVFMKVLTEALGNPVALFTWGIVLFVSGLLIVLSHNIWNAGFLALFVTLIGWALTLRGVSSMFIPGDVIARLVRWLKVEELLWLYGMITLIIGAYLTFAGFFS
ncbi:MAG: hypothetical protein ACYDHZ_05580 [Dehalococcoidia bacterium]